MDKTEIVASRMKAFSLLVVGLGFLFCALVGRQQLGEGWFWCCQVFFGAGVLVFLWMVVWPHQLVLDEEGFRLSGGFHSSPRRVAWRDVEEFVTKYGPYGTTMIGIKFRADFDRYESKVDSLGAKFLIQDPCW